MLMRSDCGLYPSARATNFSSSFFRLRESFSSLKDERDTKGGLKGDPSPLAACLYADLSKAKEDVANLMVSIDFERQKGDEESL